VVGGGADHGTRGRVRSPSEHAFTLNTGVELLGQPAPVVVRAFDSISEVEPFVINFDAQVDWLATGNSDERGKGIGLQ